MRTSIVLATVFISSVTSVGRAKLFDSLAATSVEHRPSARNRGRALGPKPPVDTRPKSRLILENGRDAEGFDGRDVARDHQQEGCDRSQNNVGAVTIHS